METNVLLESYLRQLRFLVRLAPFFAGVESDDQPDVDRDNGNRISTITPGLS